MKKIITIIIAFATILILFSVLQEKPKNFEIQNLKLQNPDIVGAVYVSDVIAEPVVKKDNSFYLSHDIYGKEDKRGCVFLDEAYDSGNNMVLYGHNNYDGSVFSNLVRYKDSSFAKKHDTITFEWTDGTRKEYKLRLVMNINVAKLGRKNPYLLEHPTDYTERFSTDQMYYRSEEPIQGNVITLSTCDETLYGPNGRLVLVAEEGGEADAGTESQHLQQK